MTLMQNYKVAKYGPIFMKFGSWSKWSMLIMNIVLGINEIDPKL